MEITKAKKSVSSEKNKEILKSFKTLGPISDLERHLPSEWWKNIFNSLYLKTDGDVVENNINTSKEVDLLISATNICETDILVDVCCGQGRHSIELARRGFHFIKGIDRSRYLIRLARKRASHEGLNVQFSEGDARKIKMPFNSANCVFLMGNSFGYFEQEEDDIAVLKTVRNILKPKGKLVLDIVDGSWMNKNFEPRSWEWIDQVHFVNRERSLSANGKRIITREVITHSEKGVLADQFYAERLYTFDEIANILTDIGFENVQDFTTIKSHSTRGQDLGMMAHRIFVTCEEPSRKKIVVSGKEDKEITVILGDPKLPDTVKRDGKFNEDDINTVKKLKNTLGKLKHYKVMYLDEHNNLIKNLLITPPKFVFNLCDEGLKNDAKMELHIPAFLEILDVPYTGSAPGCLSICYDKSKVRVIAEAIGVPVPEETYYHPSDQAANIPSTFPSLLKPAYGDSSVGITQKAVVYNATELLEYLSFLRNNFFNTPVLIQEFLSGAEYSVGLIGNGQSIEALPILEVNYNNLPKHLPKILSYESKWIPESPYWNNISYYEANISYEDKSMLIDYSKCLFERLDCRDYARFDFRRDLNNKIKLLEVNPNPGWCWDGKFNIMAGFAGIDYKSLLDKIIETAMERYKK